MIRRAGALAPAAAALGALLGPAIGCDAGELPPGDQLAARAPRAGSPAARAPLVIGNRTPHTIAEVHVAAVAERSWEPNLLPAPLPPDADAVAARLPCARYDVLVVRGDGMRCVLPNTSLCFAGEPWRIHDVTLEACLWRR